MSSKTPTLDRCPPFHLLSRLPGVAALLLAGLLSAAPALAEPDSVNVNTADAATLAEVLQGVGMSRAEAIVEYRRQHGEFADPYDLANVKGIGDRTVELNETRIRLED